MKKLAFLLTILFVLCGWAVVPSGSAGQGWAGMSRAYALETKPAYFVVIDRTGQMTSGIMRHWIQMVKMNYHFPYHKLQEDNTKAESAARAMLSKNIKPDKEALAAAAQEAGTSVLVVMVVRNMETAYVHSVLDFGPDSETYVRTVADADMYAYNADGNKFTRRFLRERDIVELGREEDPALTIKWALGNMLNRMEGKPRI